MSSSEHVVQATHITTINYPVRHLRYPILPDEPPVALEPVALETHLSLSKQVEDSAPVQQNDLQQLDTRKKASTNCTSRYPLS